MDDTGISSNKPVSTTSPPEQPESPVNSIPGVNTDYGLAQLRGNRKTYLSMLGRLINEHGNDANQIREQLACGNQIAACRLAHSLKGSSAMLGAEALSLAARQMEQAIIQGDSPEKIETSLDNLHCKITVIRGALGNYETALFRLGDLA